MGATASSAGFVGVLLIGLDVTVHGSVSATLRSANDSLIAQAEADRLSVVLLVLVYGVSTIVQIFALRYLACDRRSGWFTASTGMLTAASAGLLT
ncbi:hypothetical protein, partial [Mycobacterium sp.]|uniref:hypothetical protein n=1 Tax=Mycobacterium sp. TaxID=1785 RepID=UPI0025EEFCB0